ncbi:sulfotransferase [Salipiger mangrovisoli]|uniref:Sulfotransferase n=1 Tax=Salipiger mangrovisoli TaxID=2865933 RepID=A0ABR9X0J4_9RHOB|nr:sulfotransferase [Salipiger mangrovisoli]MBE9637064.1 sulfotransferase [Salipiger mangrovisoli]
MRRFQATFVGIGGQKCATTWLYGVLQQCPGVRVSDEKEVDFFSYYFDRGYEWYERNFAAEQQVQHRGEISPSYLIHPAAAARAAAYNPDLHVFVTLRDPVKRAFSNHLHEARKGHISGDNLLFETALGNNPLYRDQGCYATHLRRWFDHFPAERIHVFFQEEINADREAMARQVTDQLGLPPLEDFLDLRANESVRYRNPVVGEALWKVGNYARRNGLGRVVETVKSAPGISQLRSANREAMNAVVQPMKPETEAMLTDFYADEVAALEKLLNRPTPWERYKPAALRA